MLFWPMHAISDRVGAAPSYEVTKTGRQITFKDIPVTSDTLPEFRRIYSDLNNGKQPEDFGYKSQNVNSELIAEAIRAYLTNPN